MYKMTIACSCELASTQQEAAFAPYRFETDTETCHKTTSDQKTETVRSNLENNSDDVDYATNDNCDTTTNHLSDISSYERTDKGTGRKDRHDQRLVRTRESSGGRAFNDVNENLVMIVRLDARCPDA